MPAARARGSRATQFARQAAAHCGDRAIDRSRNELVTFGGACHIVRLIAKARCRRRHPGRNALCAVVGRTGSPQAFSRARHAKDLRFVLVPTSQSERSVQDGANERTTSPAAFAVVSSCPRELFATRTRSGRGGRCQDRSTAGWCGASLAPADAQTNRCESIALRIGWLFPATTLLFGAIRHVATPSRPSRADARGVVLAPATRCPAHRGHWRSSGVVWPEQNAGRCQESIRTCWSLKREESPEQATIALEQQLSSRWRTRFPRCSLRGAS